MSTPANPSKVHSKAYQNAPYKIWIAHIDGSTNNTLVVFPYGNSESKRRYMFRRAKQQLTSYKGQPIREARFYENVQGGAELGRWMRVNGHMTFTGDCAFMNTL